MAHKTLVGGTAYEITGGKDLVSGTAYSKKKGRTLVGGTGYDINFKKPTVFSYTGDYNTYGDANKGWIEMLTSGTLTISGDVFDVYLLGNGSTGSKGTSAVGSASATGGKGGKGGSCYEYFGEELNGEYAVTIAGDGSNTRTAVGTLDIPRLHFPSHGDYTKIIHGADGGAGAISKGGNTDATGKKGGDGRQPFADASPMSQGHAAQKLGAGGGGGGSSSSSGKKSQGAGGTYGGGAGAPHVGGKASSGRANTGSGGGGGAGRSGTNFADNGTPGSGGTGIAIVRWGY